MNLVLEILGDLLGLIFALFCLGMMIIFLASGRKRPIQSIREIPAFNRFRHEVGLAVESGKRLHISLGRGRLDDQPGGAALVGITMMERCARAASISDRPPVVSSGDGVVSILSQDTLRATYHNIGADRRYDPTSGRLAGATPLSYTAGAMSIIHDEAVSTNVMAGHFGGEVGLLTEAGDRSGSLTVAGSDSLPAQAVLYAGTEEPLIGEELYAGGAYLGAGPLHFASLRMQDVLRWLLAAVIVGGALLRLLGVLPK